MDSPNCPSREKVSAYLLGAVEPREAEEIGSHLAECPACQTAAGALESVADNVVALLRRSTGASQAFLDEPECRRALAVADVIPFEPREAMPPAPAAAAGPLVGRRLGDYEIRQCVGRGGMGIVYRAWDTRLERTVAIKVLLPGRTQDPQAVARFLREMKAAGRLAHQNLVRALHAGEEAGLHYLVLDFVEGSNLSALVARWGPLPVADACEAICQAACGLQHVHEHGMVHRDVKPSNLMLDREGKVVLLDLGLALLREAPAHGLDLTDSGQLMGSYDYMPPEQSSDSHRVDIRADLYSLGCTLYYLLCGRAPFSGEGCDTAGKKIVAHATRRPRPIRERRPDVPTPLAEILDRLLAKDPAARFASPAEVEAALRPFTAGADLSALAARAASSAERATTAQDRDDTGPPQFSEDLDTPADCGRDVRPPKPRSRTLRRRPLVAALVLAALVGGLVVWGLLIRIRDRQGRETTVRVPEGSQVTIEQDLAPAPAKDAPSPASAAGPLGSSVKPVAAPPGAPLSRLAMVSQPAAIPGVAAWTLETRGHRGKVFDLKYSPDGRLLASGGQDAAIRIWDRRTGELQRILIGHEGSIYRLAWSRDGSCLASLSCEDGTTRLWQVAAGRLLKVLPCPGSVLAWSPDGKRLAAGSQIWDVGSGQPIAKLNRDEGRPIGAMAWSPDGKHWADLDVHGTMCLIDGKSGAVRQSHKLGGAWLDLAWSPDGKMLAWVDGQGARFWRCGAPESPVTLPNSVPVQRIAWSADGTKIAGTMAGYSMIWEIPAGRKVGEMPPSPSGYDPAPVAWTPDGKSLAQMGENGSICQYDPQTLDLLGQTEGHLPARSPLVSLDWSPDGTMLVANGPPLQARILRLKDRASVRTVASTLDTGVFTVGCVRWSPGGQTVAVGFRDVELWGTTSNTKRGSLPVDCDWIRDMAWSPDGKRLLVADLERDYKTSLWDVGTGEPLRKLDVGSPVAWSPDGRKFTAGGSIFDAASGNKLLDLRPQGRSLAAAWSPDGGTVALGDDQGVYLFDAKSGQPLASSAANACLSLWWSEDSRRVTALEGDSQKAGGRLTVLDVLTGRTSSRTFAWGYPLRIAASPNGRSVATNTVRGTIELWDAQAGRRTLVWLPIHHDQNLLVAPSGHYTGTPRIDRLLVYVAQTDRGQETLSPEEFAGRYGWKNDSGRVELEAVLPASPEKPPAAEVRTGPPAEPRGTPVSRLAMVGEPAKLPGATAWTLETRGHRGRVFDLKYSPDGKLLASAGHDATVRIWDRESGNLQRMFVGHEGGIYRLAWSPDGAHLASGGGEDGTTRVWHVATGRLVRSLPSSRAIVAWSPDGKRLVAGNRLWNAESWTAVGDLDEALRELAWSPDGKQWAAADAEGNVLLLDPAGTVPPRKLDGQWTRDLAWSADGNLLGWTGKEGIWIWRRGEGKSVTIPDSRCAERLAWSPRGDAVAVGFNERTEVRETASGRKTADFPGPRGEADYPVSWSSDGRSLALLGTPGSIWQVDPQTGETRTQGPQRVGCPGWEVDAAWSPDGKTLAATCETHIRLYEPQGTRPIRAIAQTEGYGGFRRPLRWSSDGRTLSLVDYGQEKAEWLQFNVQSGAREKRLPLNLGMLVDQTELTGDGRRLLAGQVAYYGGKGAVWDVESGKLLHNLDAGVPVAWLPDGKAFVAGGLLFDAASGKPRHDLRKGFQFECSVAACSPDGRQIAICDAENICLFDAHGGQLSAKYPVASCQRMAWSADSRRLMAISTKVEWTGQLVVLDVDSGQVVRRTFPWGYPLSVACSPDGRTIATYTVRGTIELWDAESGRRTLVWLPIHHEQNLLVAPGGHYAGTPRIDRLLVYVVQTDRGQETLSPEEFARRYGWKNDPRDRS